MANLPDGCQVCFDVVLEERGSPWNNNPRPSQVLLGEVNVGPIVSPLLLAQTLVGWWRSGPSSGKPLSGSATSTPFSIGGACNHSAAVGVAADAAGASHETARLSVSMHDCLGGGSGGAAAAAAAAAGAPPLLLGAPPNSITGGCLAPSRGGGPCRCAEGCCEAGSPLSMCEHASAPGGGPRRLPLCSECVAEVRPHLFSPTPGAGARRGQRGAAPEPRSARVQH